MSYGRVAVPLQGGLGWISSPTPMGTTDIGSWHQELPVAGTPSRSRPPEPHPADRPGQRRIDAGLPQLLGRDTRRRDRSRPLSARNHRGQQPDLGRRRARYGRANRRCAARRTGRARRRARHQPGVGRRLPLRAPRRHGTARTRAGRGGPAGNPRRVPRSLEPRLLHDRRTMRESLGDRARVHATAI